MKKIKLQMLLICVLIMMLFPRSVRAADTISVNVEVPEKGTYTLEMQRIDYFGTVKYKLQNQVDIDLNKMDLIYNGKILTEVKRFSSGDIPDGSTIKLQPSSRWNYDIVNDVEGVPFSIARPKAETLKKVYASDYGMSPDNDDNYDALVKALKDCTSNAYLVIEKGVYHFRGMEHDIAFNNMENVIIDGNDSTFIFDTKCCMQVYGGNGVEFRNLKVNWDWDKIPVGSLVRIEDKVVDKPNDYYYFDISFIGVDEVDEDIPIGTFMYLDPDNLSVGSPTTYKAYTPASVKNCLRKVEKIDHNVLRIFHNGDMKHFNVGDYFLLRHFEYSGRVFGTTNYAKNITYDNVSIYGFTGMGWVFSYKANHFQLINSYLGLEPDAPKERRISTAADAIHILNTGGYFRISNCDLSYTGDDIINIHDDTMGIVSIDESRTKIEGWATSGFLNSGDVAGFLNSQLGRFTEYEAKVVSATGVDNKENARIVTFEEPLPEEITKDCIIYSKSHATSHYVISDNYIHEARARAALLNDDYGLFENNYVYRILSGGIQMCANVTPGRWMEGDGVHHVVARNNTFEECNFGRGEPLVKIGATVAGVTSSEVILSDICIENNVFLNCVYKEGLQGINANNVDGLIISGNVLEDGGGIVINDKVGKTTVLNNDPHLEHTYISGVCSVCNKVWEKEIDGITYRAAVEVVKRRPIAISVSDGTGSEIALTVVKAEGVEGKDVVLAEELVDELTDQKYILMFIEKDAFADSKAASITIPKSAKKIGENALGDIENIVFLGDKPEKDDSGKQETSDVSNGPEQSKPSDRNQSTVKPSTGGNAVTSTTVLEKQTITVSKKYKKKVKIIASKLKKKKMTFKLSAKAKTKLTYKVSKYPKKCKKYISVSKKGKVTLKKGCKKGTYKITITAMGTSKYKVAKRVVTIKVK